MHVLESRSVDYDVIEFPDSIHDALGVAEHAGLAPDAVYKTLVVRVVDPATAVPIKSAKPILIMLAAGSSLDLKKAAAGLRVKRVAMARHDEAERLTGLKVGGISALALLNRGFDVYLDEQAILLDLVVVSAGQRGLNLRLKVDDLMAATGARYLDSSRPSSPDAPDLPYSETNTL